MYVGLKQPRGDGECYVTPARAAAKETSKLWNLLPDNVRVSTSLAAFKNALQTVHVESECCSFCDQY